MGLLRDAYLFIYVFQRFSFFLTLGGKLGWRKVQRCKGANKGANVRNGKVRWQVKKERCSFFFFATLRIWLASASAYVFLLSFLFSFLFVERWTPKRPNMVRCLAVKLLSKTYFAQIVRGTLRKTRKERSVRTMSTWCPGHSRQQWSNRQTF